MRSGSRRTWTRLLRRCRRRLRLDRRVLFDLGLGTVSVAVPNRRVADALVAVGATPNGRGDAPIRIDAVTVPHADLYELSPRAPRPPGSDDNGHFSDIERMLPDVFDVVENELLARATRPILHAGLCSVDGKGGTRASGVLISGASRAGKSSLVVALGSQTEAHVSTDELVVVVGGGLVRGFGRPVHRRVAVDGATPPGWRAVQGWSHDLLVPPRRRSTPIPVDLVVVLDRDGSRVGVEVDPLRFGTVARLLVENSFNIAELGLDGVAHVVDLARRSSGVTVRYAEAADAADVLVRLARTDRPAARRIECYQPTQRAGRMWIAADSALVASGSGHRVVSLLLDPAAAPHTGDSLVDLVDQAFGEPW